MEKLALIYGKQFVKYSSNVRVTHGGQQDMADRVVCRHTDRHIDRQTCWQAGRQAYRLAGRKAYSQTTRHT